jgi:short-subunit dehydrogenase
MTVTTLGTALITGASTGIGAVYADRLARRGYDLILVARNRERMTALADTLRVATGREIKVVAADLTAASDLSKVESIFVDDPSISLFVNNAGSTLKGGILDNEASAFADLIALNVTATTVLASAAAKAFKARGKGAIINIASTLALVPEFFNGNEGTYSATKAFIFHLSQSMSKLLAESGIRVQAVLPGATRTELWTKSATPIDALPPEMVMDAGDLVDAALMGFDRGEIVTIPPLADEALWANFEQGRGSLIPHLSTDRPAQRYRVV